MRATFYHNFSLRGLPSLRSHDGQPIISVGDPQFRSGQFWNRSKGHGIELAEGTTNFCTNPSAEVDLSDWIVTGGSSFERVLGGIFGNYMFDFVSAAQYQYARYIHSATGSTTYTVSMYAKMTSTEVSLKLYDAVNAQFIGTATYHSGSNKWERLVITGTTGASSGNLEIRLTDERSSGWNTVLFDGVQIETKSYATPFDSVNVDGSTARSAQYLKIPTAGNFDMSFSKGTILASIRPDFAYNTSMQYLDVFSIGASGDYWTLRYEQAIDKWTWGRTTVSSAAQTFAMGDKILLIATFDGSNVGLSVNGVTLLTAAQPADPTDTGYFVVGANYNGGDDQFNGVIDEFCVFESVFTQRMVDHVYQNLFSRGLPLLQAGFKN